MIQSWGRLMRFASGKPEATGFLPIHLLLYALCAPVVNNAPQIESPLFWPMKLSDWLQVC